MDGHRLDGALRSTKAEAFASAREPGAVPAHVASVDRSTKAEAFASARGRPAVEVDEVVLDRSTKAEAFQRRPRRSPRQGHPVVGLPRLHPYRAQRRPRRSPRQGTARPSRPSPPPRTLNEGRGVRLGKGGKFVPRVVTGLGRSTKAEAFASARVVARSLVRLRQGRSTKAEAFASARVVNNAEPLAETLDTAQRRPRRSPRQGGKPNRPCTWYRVRAQRRPRRSPRQGSQFGLTAAQVDRAQRRPRRSPRQGPTDGDEAFDAMDSAQRRPRRSPRQGAVLTHLIREAERALNEGRGVRLGKGSQPARPGHGGAVRSTKAEAFASARVS